MEQLSNSSFEVLIVGAGPAGLMMACQLAMHRVSFCLIDQKESSSKNSGALIIQARSLEMFEQMGIARVAIKKGIVASKLNLLYNGKKIAGSTIKNIGEDLSPFPFLLMLEQSETENLLLEFIQKYGHTVKRGIRFVSFKQEAECILSLLVRPDGSELFIKSNYLVAADGAKSTIRNFLHIPFPGKTYTNPIYILDCKANTNLVEDEISFAFTNSSVAGFFPLVGQRWRIDGTFPKSIVDLPVISVNHIEKHFQQWTKTETGFSAFEWFSVFHSHEKYAETIRRQNCFLIGDAAHVNTPVGAQGMNTGLQDALNLAWKLSFVIRKKAKPEILDTFSTERFRISMHFAKYADIVFKLLTSYTIFIRFSRIYLLRPFLYFIFPLIESRSWIRKKFFKSISQVGIHYKSSMLSDSKSGMGILQRGPVPGERWPYHRFFYNGSLSDTFQFLTATRFNLCVFSDALNEEIEKTAARYELAVFLIPCHPGTRKLYQSFGIKNNGFYLIRPDNYISLRSNTLNTKTLENYLKKFLDVE